VPAASVKSEEEREKAKIVTVMMMLIKVMTHIRRIVIVASPAAIARHKFVPPFKTR
jgi:hypothetical protein